MSAFTPSAEQRQIIEQPLRSIRVSAGAGTGKTATVAARVVHLVDRVGLEPEQILGITFTNKAAEELADRVRSALGDLVEPGREVEVHTYHGFASQILTEYGVLVGIERNTPLVTPTFSRQMLRSILSATATEAFDATTRFAVEPVRSLAAALADNLLEPDDVESEGDDPVDAKRRDLLSIITHYRDEKARLGVADFGDLILRAHRLVDRHPLVAAAIRSRYAAVVLDEYQDTNPAQRELLRLLFSGHVPVMSVGDPDQTIYEWRGASLENFERFPEHFPNEATPAITLHLTANRRSGSAILDLANRVRKQVGGIDRLPLTPADETTRSTVATAWLDTSTHEANWIAEMLLQLAEGGTGWKDCAVLFRKNKDMAAVHDALARHDIPFEVANLGGLLSVPEVADLHSWMRILEQPESEPDLVRILLGSRYRVGFGDLSSLSKWCRGVDADEDTERRSLIEAIDRLEEVRDLAAEARERLDRFRSEYLELLRAAQGLSLVELARTILDRTGAWADLDAMTDAAGLSARLNLFRFLDLTESWSPLEGRPSLGAFLDYLTAMSEDRTEELDTARISDSNAVTLITVHRAKGLEWDVVFLPALTHNNFPTTVHYEDPTRKAEVLPFEYRIDRESLPDIAGAGDEKAVKELLRRRHLAQEWRLAYVAVTRARRMLLASGAWWYGQPEPTQRPAKHSELFLLVDGSPAAMRVSDSPSPPDRPETLGYRVETEPPPDPHFEGSWSGALRRSIADPAWARLEAKSRQITDTYDALVASHQQMLFELPEPPAGAGGDAPSTSATGLVTYATCPKRYYWSEVDRLPRRIGNAARRGIDVHRRIELHHLGVIPLEDLDDQRYDRLPTESDGTGPDPYGVFLESRFAQTKPTLVEAPFELVLDGVSVRGRIDAIYVEPPGWEIVDFKSGRPRSDPAMQVQLETYAVAATDVDFGLDSPTDLTATFVFLGGGSLIEDRHDIDDQRLSEARRHLESLAGGIASEQWEPAPGPACETCDFLRFCDPGRAHLGGP